MRITISLKINCLIHVLLNYSQIKAKVYMPNLISNGAVHRKSNPTIQLEETVAIYSILVKGDENKFINSSTKLNCAIYFCWSDELIENSRHDLTKLPGTSSTKHTHKSPWWRHQMEIFSALLAICAGNSPVTGEFPTQRPVPRSFDVFFDLRLKKGLRKQSWGWWFETLSRPLWRHCNDSKFYDNCCIHWSAMSTCYGYGYVADHTLQLQRPFQSRILYGQIECLSFDILVYH